VTIPKEDLLAMIKQDPHRPGRARGRLIDHEIPVWAIIQHMIAIGDLDDPLNSPPLVISETAADYKIPEIAVQAALAYYSENRAAIDTLIEANAAGTGW
jgi:hypothetical protein